MYCGDYAVALDTAKTQGATERGTLALCSGENRQDTSCQSLRSDSRNGAIRGPALLRGLADGRTLARAWQVASACVDQFPRGRRCYARAQGS